MLSAALVRGGLSLRESYLPAVTNGPAYGRIRAGVTLAVEPGLQRDQPNGRGSNVTITTARGASFSQRIDHPRGHSQRGGGTRSDLSEKWRDGLPDADVGRMIAIARRLEHVEHTKELTNAFAK